MASVAVGDLIDSLPPMDPVPNPPGVAIIVILPIKMVERNGLA